MFAWLTRKITNAVSDSMMSRMLQDPYTENMYSMFPIINKIGFRNIVEAGMRAESGKPIERPLGTRWFCLRGKSFCLILSTYLKCRLKTVWEFIRV